MMDMSHKELVVMGKEILKQWFKCNPVFMEQGAGTVRERPDVIGWTGGWKDSKCYVLECKRTLSDFKADMKKPHKLDPKVGMGDFRYYFVTADFYNQNDCAIMPLLSDGWGLITTAPVMRGRGRARQVVKEAEEQSSNIVAERAFLRSRILEIQRFGT